jgi:hypothetical protein
MSFTLVFDKTKQLVLMEFLNDASSWETRIEVPDLSTGGTALTDADVHRWEAKAVLEEMGTPLGEDGDRLETEIMLNIDGPVTFTANTAPTEIP